MGDDEKQHPPEQQERPGHESQMEDQPQDEMRSYRGTGKLEGKKALVTGGDSGIGRAVCAHFAEEGADVAIVYLDEDEDAEFTQTVVEAAGRKCLLIKGDVKDSKFCKQAVKQVVDKLGKINILVNNAGMQFPQQDVKNITDEQLSVTFKTNIFAYFYF